MSGSACVSACVQAKFSIMALFERDISMSVIRLQNCARLNLFQYFQVQFFCMSKRERPSFSQSGAIAALLTVTKDGTSCVTVTVGSKNWQGLTVRVFESRALVQ